MNPKINGIRKVATLFDDSDSRVKAKIVKMIKVNDGGTKIVEMNLANLCEVNKFNIMVSKHTLIKRKISYCHTK
jgi:hypothetical protein